MPSARHSLAALWNECEKERRLSFSGFGGFFVWALSCKLCEVLTLHSIWAFIWEFLIWFSVIPPPPDSSDNLILPPFDISVLGRLGALPSLSPGMCKGTSGFARVGGKRPHQHLAFSTQPLASWCFYSLWWHLRRQHAFGEVKAGVHGLRLPNQVLKYWLWTWSFLGCMFLHLFFVSKFLHKKEMAARKCLAIQSKCFLQTERKKTHADEP